VIYRDGKFLNLREVFESINLSGHDLNIDTLDMHAVGTDAWYSPRHQTHLEPSILELNCSL
jgi:hypothetical protein